ncbi:MAG TPA: hypothetical protein VMJ35_08925 [Dongiaceae bacterium]|nr:hypothetical protein [Dongiaceae bacterium]
MLSKFHNTNVRLPNCGLLPIFFILSVGLLGSPIFAAPAPKELATPGITREFMAPLATVRQAVVSVQKDHIVHGTLIFDKEPILTGAESTDSTPLFDPWNNGGEVFYKIRNQAVAPRHFLQSADQGVIAVRYVITSVSGDRTRVHIDAVYFETAHRVYRASDGSVEKAEMKEIKDALDSMIQAEMEAADARRREQSSELVRQSYLRQREDESTRLSKAQSTVKDLETEIVALRRELERRVKAPGADLKAAPYKSSANLKTLAAFTDVVVLIVSPHWLGVETPEGQRGWLPVSQLEQLP